MVGKITDIFRNLFLRVKEEGFTLPEIAIALVVFGTLSAIAVPIFLSQQGNMARASIVAALDTASTVVENEKQANAGLYPIYEPVAFGTDDQLKDLIYYYNDDQTAYCVSTPPDAALALYVGTQSNGLVAEGTCPEWNVGGDKPDAAPNNTVIPNMANPNISLLSPPNQVGRTGGEVIQVTGANFLTGATVLFGASSVPTTVVNGGTLTFINPGYSSYTSVPVQVINPNKRTSNILQFEFINPIIGTTAPAPTAVTISNKTSTSATVNATSISCPFGATPQYSFKLTQKGSTVDANGISWTDVSSRDVAVYNPNASFTFSNTNQGQQYTASAKAKCVLEGVSGNDSEFSSATQWTHPIDTPVAPSSVPTSSAYIVIINTNYTITMPSYTQCPTGTVPNIYYLYEKNTAAAAGTITGTSDTTNTRSIAAGGNVVDRYYTYSVTCKTTWATSSEGAKSANSAVVKVIAIPDTPAAPTGLWTSVGYTSTTAYWNAVTCNFGTPYYRFTWGNGWGSTTWSTSLNAAVTHAQGTYYTWRAEAKCSFTTGGVTYDSGVASAAWVGFTSPVQTPGAPYNFGNDGWGTWWWTNPSCPAGTTVQIYAYQTRHGSDYGTWVEQNWSNNTTRSGLGWYNEGLPFDNYIRARCAGPNTVSGESGTAYHGWVAYLNHWGIGADLVAWRTTRIHTNNCPPYAWGVSPSMATWIQGGAYAAGWSAFWGDHNNSTFGGRGWGSGWVTGYAYCTTSWRGSGQAGATGGW